MKQFNLDEYLANPSRKVVTRDGRSVKIHCTNYVNAYPVIAEIEGSGESHSYTKDGALLFDVDSSDDLFFAPVKHEKWVNVYLRSNGDLDFGNTYSSEKEAKDNITSHATYITTVKTEWEE